MARRLALGSGGSLPENSDLGYLGREEDMTGVYADDSSDSRD